MDAPETIGLWELDKRPQMVGRWQRLVEHTMPTSGWWPISEVPTGPVSALELHCRPGDGFTPPANPRLRPVGVRPVAKELLALWQIPD